jgi:hypothetical protein
MSCLLKHGIEGMIRKEHKLREYEAEIVRSYWMTL